MRYFILLALLAGCFRDVTSPRVNVTPTKIDSLRVVIACPFATVWDFYVDGRRLGLWGFFANRPDTMTLASPGRHELDATRWAPTIGGPPRDTVSGAVSLPCIH